jgi:hypothetical protein
MQINSYHTLSMDRHYRVFLGLLLVLKDAAQDFSIGSDERYMGWLCITAECKRELIKRENTIYGLLSVHLEVCK